MNMKTYSAYNKSEAGFTLMELIVVIAIIGLLASVGTASLSQSREKAKVAKVQSEYGAISQAIEMYRQDNKSLPPSGVDGEGISVAALVNTHLSQYIKAAPVMPVSLLSSPDVYYHVNPIDGIYYDCGPVSGREEYLLYFIGTSVANSSGQFQQVHERGQGVAGAFASGRCISATQK